MAPYDINMMASLVLNSIRSALNDLETTYIAEEMKHRLKNLELFVLCARKLGNDDAQLMRFHDGNVSTLASLFQKIHHALPATPYNWEWHTRDNFKSAIANLKKETGGWYNTLSVSLPQPTFDEVTELIDSVLEHLNDLLLIHYSGPSAQLIEALIEKIRFLRNFIRFATLRSVEPPQLLDNLLAHIHAVALDAAHTSFMYNFREYDEEADEEEESDEEEEYDEEEESDVRRNVPALLQIIKMVDPQVDETYTRALTSAKLSTHLLSPMPDKDPDPSVIMKDFIDSLLWNLWERLHLDSTPIVISTNSELLLLVYEGLRLLRSMLKEQPNKFDRRIGELTRVVICDAGILIFSLYQRDMEIDVPDSGLLQRSNRITQIVKGKDFSIPDLLQRIGRVTQMVKGKDFAIQDFLQIGQGLSDINMMASAVLYSIRYALNDLERSRENISTYKYEMKYKLKHLEVFVLCARKLGNDAQLRSYDGQVRTLSSLFQRIHRALSGFTPTCDWEILIKFERTIDNFKEEIGGWYNTLLVSLPETTFDEVAELIDSVLEHLNIHSGTSEEPIEALIEKIRLLRNFILFATLRSVKPPQLLDNLLAHIHAIAVDAAHTSLMYTSQHSDSVRLQMIGMVNPQVDETFTQALTSAKLSTRLLSPIIMKDFIDSLLWNLWERLHLDTPIVISTNSELRLVYEFLRLLSNVLKEQPNKFDKRIGELTRVVICDAGILIFSLYQRDMEIGVPDSGLLQRINRITQIVKGKDFSIPDLLQGISRVIQIVKGKDISISDLLHRIRQGLSDMNMMASAVLYSIRYALERSLNDVDRLFKFLINKHKRTKYKLKNLKLFVLCARKLGNDSQLRFDDGKVTTLASLFQRIHHAFPGNPHKLDSLTKFEGDIANLKEEISGWYNQLLVSVLQPTTFDELNEMIDSLLDNLHLILKSLHDSRQLTDGFIVATDSLFLEPSTQPLKAEALIEKIRFLRNFIRFATLRSVEPPQSLDKLLAHIHAVAVHAAHTSFMYIFLQRYDVEPNISVLLQMIKMVDPQVDETYAQALTSAKLSTHLLSSIPDKDHDPSVIMKDFIDFLLWNLWERLHLDTPIVISTNSELRLVYEGLRLLRSMLKAQPNKFDDRIGELTRVVICDAGVLIFSLYQRDMEKIVPASDLLKRISRVRQRVEGKDLSIPDLEQVGGNDFPRTNELGFIDFFLENLLGMTSSKACYGFQSQFQMIHDELSLLRFSLGKIEGRRNEQKELEALWNDGVKVVYRVEFLIDDLVLGDFQGSSSTSFNSTVEDILREVKSINSKIHPAPDIKLQKVSMAPSPVLSQKRARVADDDITSIINPSKQLKVIDPAPDIKLQKVSMAPSPVLSQKRARVADDDITSIINPLTRGSKQLKVIDPAPDIKLQKVSMAPSSVLSQSRAPVADDIVGFDDDITSIIDRLKRGSKQLKVAAIVGMPGMGKTTLATKVFNHPSVTLRFQVRLWCCVSQFFHKKNVLLELLKHVDPNTNVAMSEQDLSEKLWKDLKGKRYLIFLDDVWDIEAWDSLKASFPDDSYGSRILVTSRQCHAVPQAMLDEEALSPSKLTEDQSWELLQKKLPPRNEWSLALDEIGKQIAANCKGLPLTVVIVAGLLANTEPEGWKMFLESIRSVSGANHCMDTLELSYKHLPGHLKQCFLYFGLFPEDHEVSIKRLIRLWIAEGFVLRSKSKSIEDVARDYMMDLVGRSLVMVSKERSRGGVKACRIHDLLHDFCRTKGKEENFLQVLEGGYDEFISFKEPGYMRRLCVHSVQNHFKNLRVFCPRLHSLLFFTHDNKDFYDSDISFIIQRYRRLRVLDISQYSLRSRMVDLGYSLSSNFAFPSEILQLKYLSVACDIHNIPSSIGSLANLETFVLHTNGRPVSMPDTFWNLQKLRHVDIKNGFRLAFENLEKFPELQSCSEAIIRHGESIERLVRKFPNIRELRCQYWKDSNQIEILIPDSLRQLESLALTSLHTSVVFDDLPGNLRKLTLRRFLLHQSDVSKIGKLPNLEVLKFEEVDFHENAWDMEEGEFSKLKYLKLFDTKLVRWTASDDQFPCLEKLVLRDCRLLTEIPCCFESIVTLEMVEVYHCLHTVKNFFKRIEDEQTELGNSFLKIHISEGFDKL